MDSATYKANVDYAVRRQMIDSQNREKSRLEEKDLEVKRKEISEKIYRLGLNIQSLQSDIKKLEDFLLAQKSVLYLGVITPESITQIEGIIQLKKDETAETISERTKQRLMLQNVLKSITDLKGYTPIY